MSDKTITFSVSVPEKLKQKTDDRVSAGDFSGMSDYVRWLIRNDLEHQKKQENLRAFVQEGADALDRGEYTELNQELIDDISTRGKTPGNRNPLIRLCFLNIAVDLIPGRTQVLRQVAQQPRAR